MRYSVYLGALVVWLSGCESRPASTETAVTFPADSIAMPADSVAPPKPPVWWVPRPAGAFRRVVNRYNERRWERVRPTPPQVVSKLNRSYRRYRGTLGGQLVTVELETIDQPDTLGGPSGSGRYCPDWSRKAHVLQTGEKWNKTAALHLRETLADDTTHVADWYATQPLGAVLTGRRRDQRSGQVQPFRLREDYAGAVRYEIIDARIQADTLWRDFGDGEIVFHYKNVWEEVLHLLGPDTLRPGLRRLQCLPPQRRRAALADELSRYQQEENSGGFNDTGEETSVTVDYNGSGVLSLRKFTYSNMGPGAGSGNEFCLYDLATGRRHAAADWLRPRRKVQLWAYLIRQARQHPRFHGLRPAAECRGWPLFGLDSDGLYCDLGEVTPLDYKEYGRLTIPYAVLAPYVRPGTPLARLVAARTRPGR